MNTYTIFDNPTLYPSTYMIVSNNGYTKHCYAEAERVCVAQPIQYLPFGESYVCNHTASPYFERFTFTGKERDEETGYTYHGARYYDAGLMCSWFSVDPLSDKYPSLSPYNYCAWNPVKLVDPDGREIDDPPTKWKRIDSVIPKEKFVGWKSSPYTDEIKKKKGDERYKPNCNDYSRKQLEVVGCSASGADSKNNMYPYQENTGVDMQQTEMAISYIQNQLEQGNPVMIGVDEGKHLDINEGTTDHFLVIVGQGNDENGNYFLVFDNARSNANDGTNEQNRIYQLEDGRLYGEMPRADNRYTPYTISQVRTTKRNKKGN